MKIFAETERLILREIERSDISDMFELDSDPDVYKYLGKKPVTTKNESIKIIDFIREQYVDRGIGRWAVILKESQEFLGWSGLKLNTEEELNGFANFYDVGYRFKKKYWNKGYATESGKASIEYAFNIMHLNKVYGITEIGNQASHKVLLKIGLKKIQNFYYKKEDLMLRWYEIINQM